MNLDLVRVLATASLAPVLLIGCSNQKLNMPGGADAYRIFPASLDDSTLPYRIGPADVLSVVVFAEPDLSVPQLRVGNSGEVSLPLIGAVKAQGMTAEELGRTIEDRLGARYIVSPKVSVNVTEAVSSRVTVEGQVVQPGIYPVSGAMTLLDCVALSRGTTQLADLDQVAIFRVIDGKQMAARFNLTAIRRGEAPNPAIHRDDVVVVGFDKLTSLWRDFLSVAPLAAIFATPFR